MSDEVQELAGLTRALAHPIRVRIVQILGQRSCVCGDLVEELPVAHTTVWQHLRVLKDAGVIKGEIDGPAVCYSLDATALERLVQLIGSLQGATTGGLT